MLNIPQRVPRFSWNSKTIVKNFPENDKKFRAFIQENLRNLLEFYFLWILYRNSLDFIKLFEGLIPTALHFLSEDQNTHQFSEKDEVSLKVIIVVNL